MSRTLGDIQVQMAKSIDEDCRAYLDRIACAIDVTNGFTAEKIRRLYLVKEELRAIAEDDYLRNCMKDWKRG